MNRPLARTTDLTRFRPANDTDRYVYTPTIAEGPDLERAIRSLRRAQQPWRRRRLNMRRLASAAAWALLALGLSAMALGAVDFAERIGASQ